MGGATGGGWGSALLATGLAGGSEPAPSSEDGGLGASGAEEGSPPARGLEEGGTDALNLPAGIGGVEAGSNQNAGSFVTWTAAASGARSAAWSLAGTGGVEAGSRLPAGSAA